jgi:hypothetical protein
MILRREADASGDAQVSSLLESLEPILLISQIYLTRRDPQMCEQSRIVLSART